VAKKERKTFQKAWDDKNKSKMIRGRKDSSHLSSRIVHNHIGKAIKHKMSPIWKIYWVKGRDKSL
jgi:hypothetical protein